MAASAWCSRRNNIVFFKKHEWKMVEKTDDGFVRYAIDAGGVGEFRP